MTNSLNSLTQEQKWNLLHPDGVDWSKIEPDLNTMAILENNKQKWIKDHYAKVKNKAREYVDTMEETARIQYSRKRTPYWYVTINPKPGITIKVLHNQIVELLKHPDITDPFWCYEVRKKNDGLHAHLVFTCHTQDKNFANRKVKALFVPGICGTRQHVHIKWVTEGELSAVKSYIAKTTIAKSKKNAASHTLTWRKENKIPDVLDEDHLLVWSEIPPRDDPKC